MDTVVLDIKDKNDIENVIFLDAVDFGSSPGTKVLLERNELPPPQQSHEIHLAVYAAVLEAAKKTVFCLGVQPAQLEFQQPLSVEVMDALQSLTQIFEEILKKKRQQ